MVRAIQDPISSQAVFPSAAAPAPKGSHLPAPQSEAPSGRSLAGRAFIELTGSAFSKADSPSMEYLIYEIFRETARAKVDLKTLDFLLDSLQDDASQNLQPVLRKCVELAQSNPALAARLAKRLSALEPADFQSSAALGLNDEIQEADWTRLGMLAAAALAGLLVLSALFSSRPLPKPAEVPCLPSEAPPAEEARPLPFANQTQPSPAPLAEETPPPAALHSAEAPAPQSNIDRFIEGVGLPPGVTRPQLEQAVAAAEARENLRKFFDRNREMFTPLEKETPPAPEPVPNPTAEHAEPSLFLIPAAVATGIGIIRFW